ncbi:hypothetical protein C900_03926 [Fulvivirga imtechensis AK7]|uniref:Phosphatidic acid phosphatase type 2/haloperoxidase domain-containing protein n=1 Tax=Fulvivirga imtechensis AK7 TaxID=1237149 RepID=L8JMW0_9BACT|nr:phosphatase PAP2 family protein [Fulvivirga imtechensis]ELR70241.1 hypothetical protein C900_03926 [Fulvivirga imtechensis AK7]
MALTTVALATLTAEDHTGLSKYQIQESIQTDLLAEPQQFQTSIDDHLRYAPVVMVYGLNMMGIHGENNFGERTIILSKIFLLQHVLTSTMKKGFGMVRPSGEGLSFPSAHTSRAFATATFMHHEYKDVSPWYSVAGYTFAVATGALRVINNHHWLPDVLVGAGVGILATELVYLTHQHKLTKWLNRDKKKRNKVMMAPVYNGKTPGIYMSLSF